MTDRLSQISDDGVPPTHADGDNETVFLVYLSVFEACVADVTTRLIIANNSLYSFIFTLQEFARELVSLVDAMGRIYALEQQAAFGTTLWRWVKDRFTCLRVRSGRDQNSATAKSARPSLRRRLGKAYFLGSVSSPTVLHGTFVSSVIRTHRPASAERAQVSESATTRTEHSADAFTVLFVPLWTAETVILGVGRQVERARPQICFQGRCRDGNASFPCFLGGDATVVPRVSRGMGAHFCGFFIGFAQLSN